MNFDPVCVHFDWLMFYSTKIWISKNFFGSNSFLYQPTLANQNQREFLSEQVDRCKLKKNINEINCSNDYYSDMFFLHLESLFSIIKLESLEIKENHTVKLKIQRIKQANELFSEKRLQK